MKKVEFDKHTFYINSTGDGSVSGETVGVTKFYGQFLQWNRKYKPEKVSKDFLRTLINR